ncbi:olfactory receptor 11A1-like [Paramacrobiotus metropolitanus]|uniref:olfactory receptor 11A1-like n=1 Tax=Paramacrobiotus metropolitanus TaxID=2943436 RepID=UPI0024463D61|nr:olfactory receptor 11A1-like [Paramacrobiotus metropolitanus]
MNVSNSTPPVYHRFRLEVTVWYSIMTFLSTTGCTLSILLLLLIALSKKLRTRSSALFLNLLLQVALQCGVGMPLLVQSYQGVPFSLAGDKELCRRTFIFYFIIVHCVDWTDLMIAVNRFIAVCLPHKYPQWTRGFRLYSMVVAPWLIGLGIALLPQFGIGGEFRRFTSWESCGVFYYNATWSLVFVMLGIGLPVSSTFLLYLTIFAVVLYRHFRVPVAPVGMGEATRRTQKRYRSVRMFFGVFVCYAGCLLPPPIANGFFQKEYSSQPMLQLIFRAVMLLGNALIPVIYLIVSKDYRAQLRLGKEKLTSVLGKKIQQPELLRMSGITSSTKQTAASTNATSNG